ncbi:hypothetical protein WMW71_06740 [Flavobacterium buctense]|uniref:Uncharacterized protein n=1 Tax=Flavobacterium buctense TaxID=1648146 RepID=A0ABU9E1Y1_9FLAO|nr:hypothetical protein [Flavobacterium buctense]
MKQVLFFLLVFYSTATFAKVETDTINNWQLYKDNKLIFKSNEVEKSFKTIEIKSNDNFKVLKFNIFYDFFGDKTSKKIEFIVDNKVVSVLTKENEAVESFVIERPKIKDLISNFKNKTVKLKYYDKIYPKGIIVCQLKFI